MAYEYEKDILELLKDIEKERSLDLSKEINEIQGTYQTARLIDNIVTTTKKRLTEQERKAKAFDEIRNIDLAQHDEEYADNVMKLVNKFTEEKND
ncbi:hypothetical protein ASS90_12060 [Staphylococcus saprophyticus]|uniref:hypothetical protein n=1 Tax=Staphylococcus saprophyticus TaxID=29385 RepID=UPI000852BC60|nr:hypothetical protein [Staphylococcus saprophyticus]MDW4396779.1 hypothetical protein [Staphylococcus saprophyticus]MDW4434518.1 hypothetical protein [Staphylococcus saprophyticus]OEK41424.1 hypothetical protein ASS90_12060 [Staphylococcus saprophyticus]